MGERCDCEERVMAGNEYIEREKLPKRKEYWDDDFGAGWDACLDAIVSIPAADVRPVVLCRDCKHNMANIPDIRDGMNINENWNACQLTELYDSVKPDDFCSHGVKREENK